MLWLCRGTDYHHIENNDIGLFSTFIFCDIRAAVEIIEALIKNQSDIKPTTAHTDTLGRSTVVFALAHLLGKGLMPRICNRKDLKLFRPGNTNLSIIKSTSYSVGAK